MSDCVRLSVCDRSSVYTSVSVNSIAASVRVHLSVYLRVPVYLSVYPPACPPVCLSVCPRARKFKDACFLHWSKYAQYRLALPVPTTQGIEYVSSFSEIDLNTGKHGVFSVSSKEFVHRQCHAVGSQWSLRGSKNGANSKPNLFFFITKTVSFVQMCTLASCLTSSRSPSPLRRTTACTL